MTMQPPITPKDSKTTPLPVRSNGVTAEAMPPAAWPIDPASLTDEQLPAAIADLQAKVADLQAEIARRKEKKDADFLTSIADTARALNMPPSRIAAFLRAKGGAEPGAAKAADGSTIGGRAHVAPKYRNPKNPSETWSGRGEPPPKWVRDHLDAGGSKEDLRIPEDGG